MVCARFDIFIVEHRGRMFPPGTSGYLDRKWGRNCPRLARQHLSPGEHAQLRSRARLDDCVIERIERRRYRLRRRIDSHQTGSRRAGNVDGLERKNCLVSTDMYIMGRWKLSHKKISKQLEKSAISVTMGPKTIFHVITNNIDLKNWLLLILLLFLWMVIFMTI